MNKIWFGLIACLYLTEVLFLIILCTFMSKQSIQSDFFIYNAIQEAKNKPINLSCPKQTCICNPATVSFYESPVPLFMEEARLVANANYYEKGLYDCENYAKELYRRLTNDGYTPS